MININLEEQIKLLVELQGLDTHIFRMERELASIPEDIKKMDDEFKEKSDNLKKLEEGVKALQVKRREREVDLEAKEGGIKKYQAQLYQIKTNKEYTALQQEIERIKADNSLIEEEIIKILDQIDAENKKITGEKELLRQGEVRLADEKGQKDEESKQLKSEIERLKTQREGLAGKIDKSILSKYERILRKKDGLAVVPVASEACQGCFRILPPQVINEIKMKSELVFCENCARILYIEE